MKYLLLFMTIVIFTRCAGGGENKTIAFCSHPAVNGGALTPVEEPAKLHITRFGTATIQADTADGVSLLFVGAQCVTQTE